MKKWIIIAVLTSCVSAFAEKGGGPDQETKEQFIKRVETNTKKRGEQLDKNTIETRFQEMDTNQDGIVTREERRVRVKKAPQVEKATVDSLFSAEEIKLMLDARQWRCRFPSGDEKSLRSHLPRRSARSVFQAGSSGGGWG